MKKNIFLITAALIMSLFTFGQGRGGVGTVIADTLNGNEVVNFYIGSFTGTYESLTIQALCTEVGGTSDGTLTMYGSLDNTNWSFINGVGAGVITASPKASITGADLNQVTITDGLVATWVLNGTPYKYIRLVGDGTASDSTLISIRYMYK